MSLPLKEVVCTYQLGTDIRYICCRESVEAVGRCAVAMRESLSLMLLPNILPLVLLHDLIKF